MPASSRSSERGFTIVEMAIVLLIISLVIGATFTGKELLRNSQIRSIYTDTERYIGLVQQFTEKYGGLPGDMYDAESVWGQAAAGASCDTTNNGNKTTCNGDGDGQIETGVTTGAGGVETAEIFRAWQHIYNAGMLETNLRGIPGSGGTNHAVVTDTLAAYPPNVPRSLFEGTGFTLYYQAVGNAAFFTATDVYNHILLFGKETSVGITNAAALLPKEAHQIDAKVDDGLPGIGSVRTYVSTSQANCATTAVASTAAYLVTYETAPTCNLVFITGF
jgi:prepilin-type N-terminal cleavage/methylation domain-containing protein